MLFFLFNVSFPYHNRGGWAGISAYDKRKNSMQKPTFVRSEIALSLVH